MAIYVDSCAAQDTIVVTTRSSVYELVVLRGDRGDVLVRGGRHFTEVTPCAISRFDCRRRFAGTTHHRYRSSA